ncbi:MAG: phosphate acyltransferase PlsX [Pseudomonadota bacterium]
MQDHTASGHGIRIALDVMGADKGLSEVLDGVGKAYADGLQAHIVLHGREEEISSVVNARGLNDKPISIIHAEDIITMEHKPTDALRRGKKSSMWSAIATVKNGDAAAAVSSGNTGALMAMGVLQLRKIEGIDRPAIGCIWPTIRGKSVVLDVGANVEATSKQLVQFAIMGEAYFRALTAKQSPTVGLLNVGAEEMKGHDLIRTAATILKEADREMDFVGFVEGNGISFGEADVVVTDGFTGNVALKTAEGTARMIGGWMKDALTANLLSKAGAALMMPSLKNLKQRMDPSEANGAPLLGLNGLVIKSHGGSDADGIAAAVRTAETLANHPFQDEIRRTVAKVEARAEEKHLAIEATAEAAAE